MTDIALLRQIVREAREDAETMAEWGQLTEHGYPDNWVTTLERLERKLDNQEIPF